MAGGKDLARLVASMSPVLSGEPWGFARARKGLAPGPEDFALIREAEGLTLIAPVKRLEVLGLDPGISMARISLTVHSSFEAVGLTAAISGALADAGLSANVVAGYYHDHIFVPWEDREQALAVLEALAGA